MSFDRLSLSMVSNGLFLNVSLKSTTSFWSITFVTVVLDWATRLALAIYPTSVTDAQNSPSMGKGWEQKVSRRVLTILTFAS